ncbi:RING finger protein 145-like [Notechis scutatus]|uniref:RING finger protein 145-like n=1 Tax=Notechis scutatus TaxID=8663 RepID=A0A6J1VW17_9SAUR|nr:RING finger protein 145-like [Notechis scutatus]
MAYKIAHFFQPDFWLVILVSSCMLTSLQVTGTLFVYGLFVAEFLQKTPVEKMDEILYCVQAVSRVLEFLVALCVVTYGAWGSIVGEWTWLGASVIVIHCYFNVWRRAQSGWQSFSLRWEAAKKIGLLPGATRRQLEDHNDVCAICFQEMTLAVIMPCGHFFHKACLRKWFYVQDTCPLCHQPFQVPAAQKVQRDDAEPEATPQPERGETVSHQNTAESHDDEPPDSGMSSCPEQPGPLPAGSAGEDPHRGHPHPGGTSLPGEENDQRPVLEKLEARSVGQHPSQSDLRLPSMPTDPGPPWPSAPRGVKGHRERPRPTDSHPAAPGSDAQTVGEMWEKLDSLSHSLPASLPDPRPTFAGISPEKPSIP